MAPHASVRLIYSGLFFVLLAAILPAAVAAQARQVYHAHPAEREIGYAQAIRVGNVVYVSGTIGAGETMDDQVTDAYQRIEATLAEFGVDLDSVVREVVYTTDMVALQQSIPTRKALYGEHAPAATWVEIDRLFMDTALVEIEVTAVIGEG